MRNKSDRKRWRVSRTGKQGRSRQAGERGRSKQAGERGRSRHARKRQERGYDGGVPVTDTCAVDEVLADPPFLPATLEGVRRCPARSEYIELCFTTPEGAWNWCFPAPPRRPSRPGGAIALTVGPYSVLARLVRDDGRGPALDSAAALSMILAGADVVIARRLVTAGR